MCIVDRTLSPIDFYFSITFLLACLFWQKNTPDQFSKWFLKLTWINDLNRKSNEISGSQSYR